MTLVKNWMIGADIEVFLQDKKTKEIVSAEGIIKGTKHEPYKFDAENKYYATSLDNVMAEFCIPPAKSPYQFYRGVKTALKYINSTIPKNLETLASPAQRIDEKYLQTESAKLFGCELDFDAWTTYQNETPGAMTNLRSCGGHIHIGYEEPSNFISLMLMKAMDIFVGVASVLMEPDNERKNLYGRAGAFRHKSYGVEYRTVSNYYLQSKELTKWAFDNTKAAIDFVNEMKVGMLGYEDQELIVSCINTADKDLARQLIEKFNVKLAA